MNAVFKIINGTEEEEQIINDVIELIERKYPEKVYVNELKEIEIVDRLPYGSSARSIKNKIFLARKNGLEGVFGSKEKICIDKVYKMLISTIYHELWHVSTWNKYEYMYEYITSNKKRDLTFAYACMYWIEYIAHYETVYMEVPEVMKDFCENFVCRNWDEIEYGYSCFIKELPYYLIRSQYLNIYDVLTSRISNDEFKQAVHNFDKVSRKLLLDTKIDDEEKAKKIAVLIEKFLD